MEESQSAARSSSGSSSKLNSHSNPEENGKGKQKESTTKSTSKTTQRASSPNLHPERKHSSSESLPRRSSSRSPARSPARSTHSSSNPPEKDRTPIGVKQQAEGTHKLVEYVDEDGISHWHHARQEHVNLHTECGRHGDEWLFGGWSLMEVVRGLLRRR